MSAANVPAPIDDGELAELVFHGAAALSLDLAGAQIDRLVTYIRLIERWNATYNLTAIRDPRDMATQHIVDCLAAAAALERRRGKGAGERVLDVGSGAGLPGIVLAVVSEQRHVVCVDSVGKKSAFLMQVAGTLGLKHVAALHGRVESMRSESFDVITSRAFASLHNFSASTRHLLGEFGEWMAMKGKRPVEELEAIRDLAFHVEPLTVPDVQADRCIVWMKPRSTGASARL